MIENNTFNKVELLRAHMLIHSVLLGALFCTLPIQENNDIKNVEIKNYIFYFNSDYIENENFEDIVVNISINLIQFYFECNNYDINLMFTIKAFLSRYRWYKYDKYQNSFNNNMNILADKLKKINIQKSSIIYYSNRNQQFRTYNHVNFDNVIQYLPHDSNFIQHDINNDVDINSVIERCQFIFQIPSFDLMSEMNIFFNKYIHNFSQFILFLYLMRFHVTQFTFVNFVRYHKPPFDIIDICSEIYFHSISFQTKELKEKIDQFFNNFTLEEKDYFLLNE